MNLDKRDEFIKKYGKVAFAYLLAYKEYRGFYKFTFKTFLAGIRLITGISTLNRLTIFKKINEIWP